MSIWVVPREPSRPKQGEKVFLFAPRSGISPGLAKGLPAGGPQNAIPHAFAEAVFPKFNRSLRMEKMEERLLERRVRVGL